MSKSVRVAVLGLGQRGLQHVRSLWGLHQDGLAEIVALADAFDANIQPEKIQQYVPGFEAGNILLTTDFAAVLDAKPEAIYICIPPNLHAGQVLAAATQGSISLSKSR
ncbi:MAG: Gfo/Idh/MocA family oxidoreductase [Caldilineaceae bacterium]|nr:Gfo/Idh/MocA family oxidoreductase [Caldilineaceae bacterium]